MRLSLIAIAGLIGLGIALLVGTSVTNGQVAPQPKDEVLRQLLKNRREASAMEVEAKHALYRAGRVQLDSMCSAIERFATASVEAAGTPAERVKAYQEAFSFAKDIEDAVRQNYERDVEPVQALKHASYTRYDLEIKLYLARNAAGLNVPPR